ncbi:MAG TPA: GNAT family N-acetyltransferase [Streptosporangiaceae bacterium]|nr:GNAT family N-acetyltransferase [Streptosporangiaceae bacterium]
MGRVGPGYSRPRPIGQDDDTSQFSCGDDPIDQWLRRYAIANHFGGGARTYVTLRDSQVVGYYALAAASIQRADATPRAAKAMPQPVPAILLGRLGVDRKEAGQGLGTFLLRDAVIRTLGAADVIGVRVLLVHAASEDARNFYLKRGFDPSPTDPMHLMVLLKDARSILGNKT